MKTPLLFLALAASACSILAADVTGTWKAEVDTLIGVQKYTFTLKQDGPKVTGKASAEVNGEKRETELKEGKLDGDTITFVEPVTIQGSELNIAYRGKVKPGEIQFTREVGDLAKEEFTARRQTAADQPAVANDEICAACGQDVRITGNFAHRKDDASVVIKGATNNESAFREEINGTHFTVSIAHLPAGSYTILIGEAETLMESAGERLFDVTAGGVALATNFDIVATAGGARKVCYITSPVEHEDDSIKGPLEVSFEARKNTAKFNTFEVKNASGASAIAFNASDMAEAFTAAAVRIPEINEPPIWRDSSQPLQAREKDLIRRMSLAEKVAQLQNGAPAIARLGLSAYDYWSEALHGVANSGNATVFPQAVGMASTWDPDLIRQEASVIGIEGRAKFNDYASKHNGNGKWFVGLTFWSPNINIFRDPRWGRGQETYGEDPFLAGTLAVAFIKGMQGDDPQYMKAMACAKHFAVHSGPEPERHKFNATPPERDLYETYLPQFEMAVREGHVGGVMGAYNAINGVPACANSLLLTDLLRNQWGFDGYVVSDCSAIHNIWGKQEHRYLTTPEEAAAVAVKAGCNLCCGGDYTALVKAVQKNVINEQEIDQALCHTLWTRFRLGLFDPPEKCAYSKITIKDNDTPEHEALALKVAQESIVLLKNHGLLPLNRARIKRIAVIGTNAVSAQMLEGNYNGRAARPVTILNGIKQAAGPGIEVTFAAGGPLAIRKDGSNKPTQQLIDEAVAAARSADVVVFVGGISARFEGEESGRRSYFDGFLGGDRTQIELPEVQTDLLKKLAATGRPVILVNCSGSPMAFPWAAKHLPAILQAWYPGEQGGRAVGEILFGDINPSGHLPLTFYASTADLPDFRDYSMSNRTYRYFKGKPEFAFGRGLSYSKFKFQNGKLDAKKIPADGTAKVSFTVKNSAKREGDEVAQVYFRHVHSAVSQPKLALCGFTRVHLERGGTSRVTVEVPVARLRYWDARKKQYVIEPGDYEILVGAASDDIRLKLRMAITPQ
jgi:beta-glucosidase